MVKNRYGEVDEKMRVVVSTLNDLGINTMASCEGHLDHGVAAPWVDVVVEMSEDLANLNKKADELQVSAEHILKEMTNRHEANRLLAEYEVVKDEILRINLQETVDLSNLLEEFYKKRDIEFRIKLVINIYGRGVGRLISQGGLYQEAFTKEVQAKYLEEYQQEMKDFGEFLKRKGIKI